MGKQDALTTVTSILSTDKFPFLRPTDTSTSPADADGSNQQATGDTLHRYVQSPRVTSITSNATWAPNCDTTDIYQVTAQAVAATTISNPSGTPVDGQQLLLRIKDDGTARAMTWSGSQWRSQGGTLPITTFGTANQWASLYFMWNATDSKWDLTQPAQAYSQLEDTLFFAAKANINSPTFTGTPVFPTGIALTSPTGLGVPQVAVVASDVTHAQSNTTLSNITGLTFTIGASATEVWFFEGFLMVNAASGTPDLKLAVSTGLPSGATGLWGVSTLLGAGFFGAAAAAGAPLVLTSAATSITGIGTVNGTTGVSYFGFIFGGGTGGAIQSKFAQNTSDASDLIIKAGSFLRFTKIAA